MVVMTVMVMITPQVAPISQLSFCDRNTCRRNRNKSLSFPLVYSDDYVNDDDVEDNTNDDDGGGGGGDDGDDHSASGINKPALGT